MTFFYLHAELARERTRIALRRAMRPRLVRPSLAPAEAPPREE